MLANPIPFHLDVETGGKAILRAHLAKANPQVQHLQDGAKALVVFQGMDAYVSPSWYRSKKVHGKVVPTWNFVMVQVRGSVRRLDDAELYAQVSALTDAQEQMRSDAWSVTDAPENFIAMQMRAIVGIEITIDDIRGKWKVSQNRSTEDQAGVAEGYAIEGRPDMEALVRRQTTG